MVDDLTTRDVRPLVCAVIPARGGSKGIPRKNLEPVGGVPLVVRAIRSLRAAHRVDLVVVSTDDAEIAAVAAAEGATVVDRPADLAGDTASSESAVEHADAAVQSRGVRADVLMLVQATSPFIDPAAVDRAVELVASGAADTAFAAARTDVFLWTAGPDGATGVNHDLRVRPRRQDRDPEWAETGAFYAMRADGFRERLHRFFGRVEIVEVPAALAVDVDTPDDLELARRLAETERPPIAARAVVTDFDGVHTRDRVVVDQDGIESVEVNRSDGMGVARLRGAGIPFLILSGETNPVVQARARKLGVDVVAGCDDKLGVLRRWAADHQVGLEDIAYLGNDVNDVACLDAVGWPVVVADAHPDARRASRIVLRHTGGGGAVRELADRVLAGVGAQDERHRTTEGHDDE